MWGVAAPLTRRVGVPAPSITPAARECTGMMLATTRGGREAVEAGGPAVGRDSPEAGDAPEAAPPASQKPAKTTAILERGRIRIGSPRRGMARAVTGMLYML